MQVKSVPFAGSQFTVGQVMTKAQEFDRTTAQDATSPYQKQLDGLNDTFVSVLDKYDDNPDKTIGDLRAELDQTAKTEGRKANIASLVSLGGYAAGFLLGNLPTVARIGLFAGGFAVNRFVAAPAAAKANEAEYLSASLMQWGSALEAQEPPQQKNVA